MSKVTLLRNLEANPMIHASQLAHPPTITNICQGQEPQYNNK